jgi:hypothetical protein
MSLAEEAGARAHMPRAASFVSVPARQEWEIVRAILKEHPERRERIWGWKQRTQKSEKAFDRRRAEVVAMDAERAVSEVTEVSEVSATDG